MKNKIKIKIDSIMAKKSRHSSSNAGGITVKQVALGVLALVGIYVLVTTFSTPQAQGVFRSLLPQK